VPSVLPAIKEDLLQFIWEQQLFTRHALRTTDGKPLQVIKPGRVQGGSGPDLVDARVRIDGQLLAGTIEVHLRGSDWYAHKHEKDPAYDSVVLHVVYEHDMAVRTARGGRVAAFELKHRIDPRSLEAYQRLMKNKAWVPCEDQLAQVDRSRVDLWLERVLVERLQRKTADVGSLIKRHHGDAVEAFYHVLLQAFGHKVNAEPFGMLAHALPLKVLQKYRDDELRTEALLFGQAGLLRTDFVDEHPRTLQREHALLRHMHGLKPAPTAAWKFARSHPPNFPTVRIAQFARLVMKCDGSFTELIATDELDAIREALDVTAGGYWTDRFSFDQPSSPQPKHLGRAAADHLVINAIVPFRFAQARLHGDEDGIQRALELLGSMPPEANAIVGGWDARGVKAGSAARSQALIELKNQYCAQRRCLLCGIGTELLKRTSPSMPTDLR